MLRENPRAEQALQAVDRPGPREVRRYEGPLHGIPISITHTDHPANEKERTQRDLQEREDFARHELGRVTLFDSTVSSERRDQFAQVEQIAKAYLRERIQQAHGSTTAIDVVEPMYVLSDLRVRARSLTDPAVRIHGMFGGYVDQYTGLVRIYGGRDFSDIVDISRTVAHELSHASGGLSITINSQTKSEVTRMGLERRNYGIRPALKNVLQSRVRGEVGRFLENGMATIDECEVLARVKGAMAGQGNERVDRGFAELAERYNNPSDSITKSPANLWGLYPSLRMDAARRIIAAKELGVPHAWIEGTVKSPRELDIIVGMWKLARILGKHALGEIDTQGMSTEEHNNLLVEKGRALLEESRYQRTDTAYAMIREVFGGDRIFVLDEVDYPKSYVPMLKALNRAERKLHIPSRQQVGKESYRLY